MEENRENQELEQAVTGEETPELTQPAQEGYVPRPAWQVWAARIGLVLFILFVIYQMFSIAGGGL